MISSYDSLRPTVAALGAMILACLWFSFGASNSAFGEVTLSVTDAVGLPGTERTVTVEIDTDDAPDSWELKICHDDQVIAPIGADEFVDDFLVDLIIVEFDETDGVRMVVEGRDSESLPTGNYDLLDITYDLRGEVGDSSDLSFCEDGTTETVVVIDGDDVEPGQVSGVIFLGTDLPLFTFTVTGTTAGYSAGTGERSMSVEVTLEEHDDSPDAPNDTFGFAMAISHDSTFLDVTAVNTGEGLDSLNDDDGPEFFTVELLEDGFTLEVIYSEDDSDQSLTADSVVEVATIDYDTVPENLIDVLVPTVTDLEWSDDLGDPVVENSIQYTFDGDNGDIIFTDATITLIPGGPFFTRGDCNGDSSYNLGDPLRLLTHLYFNRDLSCEDACDANDSGNLTISDVLLMLANMFQGGHPPSAPYPNCGGDREPDELVCETQSVCI